MENCGKEIEIAETEEFKQQGEMENDFSIDELTCFQRLKRYMWNVTEYPDSSGLAKVKYNESNSSCKLDIL